MLRCFLTKQKTLFYTCISHLNYVEHGMKSVVDAALRLVRCAHVQVLLLLLRGNNNGFCDRVWQRDLQTPSRMATSELRPNCAGNHKVVISQHVVSGMRTAYIRCSKTFLAISVQAVYVIEKTSH